MRFRVPQNIDMQDRIVGPLTMTQFVEAIVGAGLAYGAFTSLPAPLSIMAAIFIALLTFAIVFIKINERPFLTFVGHVAVFMGGPKKMVWHQADKPNIRVQFYRTIKQEGPAGNLVSNDEIANLAGKIDTAEQKNFLMKR